MVLGNEAWSSSKHKRNVFVTKRIWRWVGGKENKKYVRRCQTCSFMQKTFTVERSEPEEVSYLAPVLIFTLCKHFPKTIHVRRSIQLRLITSIWKGWSCNKAWTRNSLIIGGDLDTFALLFDPIILVCFRHLSSPLSAFYSNSIVSAAES